MSNYLEKYNIVIVVRNPFAPGGDYALGTTTYEKIRQKGFIQPEVDPYWK